MLSCETEPASGIKGSPLKLEQIVADGLCIGCGLCVALAGPARVKLVLTPEGRERPIASQALDLPTLEAINAACPGTRVEGARPETRSDLAATDIVWGQAERLAVGYASDPQVRRQASTGGVLTALGQFLLSTGRAKFVLHVGASRSQPMRTEARISYESVSVLEGAGSRYGPAAPLLDFGSVLERREPFALIAKPCDIAAVRNLARQDARVDRYLTYALTFSCGGASDLRKSEEILATLGLEEHEVSLFRYRGEGNPGPTRIDTYDGRSFELTYNQVWEDEAKWMIQPRCKICPDAIGESADLVATDVWPGGGPTGEDAGFNGIIVRTLRGLELFQAALAANVISLEPRQVSFRDFDLYQPHQVRKKRAAWVRMQAMRDAGLHTPDTINLRLQECSKLNSAEENLAERNSTLQRVREGRLGEPRATARSL
jgi:coenzyme F420 hydrogenase subunit beta